jgi:NADH-quinone oxidoreductase subunit C
MELLEQIQSRLAAVFPGATVRRIPNDSPSGQHSLLIDAAHAVAVAQFLRAEPGLQLDYCSNVTGVDWPEAELSEKVKVKKVVDGVEKEGEEIKKSRRPAHLEVVYHLYSMERRLGPVILRLRTDGRAAGVKLPSLTPVWRSCEFQEREIYDLFGIVFEGHPDLRRILMWEGFQDHPMRKDYVEPDDYDYEPTPHDDVLVKVHQRRPPSAPPS